MLGTHSIVVRVNDDGSLMPFEVMPELFLGRSIRQILTGETRSEFEAVCREVAETETAQIFTPDIGDATDDVMITPVLDDDGTRCRFLVCWARHQGEDAAPPPGADSLSWSDLTVDAMQVRYRAAGDGVVEAAPWWAIADSDGIELWRHHQRVTAVGLAHALTAELVAESMSSLRDHDDVQLRIAVPAAEMLAGLVPVFHGMLRQTGIDAERVVLAVPVELAVDPDLLPLIVHLRTMGLQIDLVGLDALTAKLHKVSDTSSQDPQLPAPTLGATGDWVVAMSDAITETESV